MTPSLCGGLWEATIMSSPFTAKVVSSHSVRIFGVESYMKKNPPPFCKRTERGTVLLSRRVFTWPAPRRRPIPRLTGQSPPTEGPGDLGRAQPGVVWGHSRVPGGLVFARSSPASQLEAPRGVSGRHAVPTLPPRGEEEPAAVAVGSEAAPGLARGSCRDAVHAGTRFTHTRPASEAWTHHRLRLHHGDRRSEE